MAFVAQVLGDTEGWQHMTGWAWGWMVLGWLLFLTLIGAVVWTVSRASGSPARRPDATEILAERFARGELSVEEFEERRCALRGETRGG
ncbi:MAG: SHOCT domain-containing protein [Acidobacteria bacterium]|nr:SHOCT domain-containing protein [Acidobacteriota bacterium]